MKLTLGFSPCPNDTYIFDALVNGAIDTGSLSFEVVLEDVETLNQWALNGKLAITKLSYGVLPRVMHQYRVLNSGSALGKGVGPLYIQHPNLPEGPFPVAIPGENTTAHLIFSRAYPQVTDKVFLRYDEIESFVMNQKGRGVIIHENRFTYAAKGLEKIADLGDHWEQSTGQPIPLGGIVVKRSVPVDVQQQIDRLIRQSIEYANQLSDPISSFVACHAQEMSRDVMLQHIGLYVNEYSIDLGAGGRSAITSLLAAHPATQHLALPEDLFVPHP